MYPNKQPIGIPLDTSESSLNLEQITHVLREKAWLITLFGVIGIFAGLAYIHQTPVTYQAQAVLQVDPEQVRVTNFEDVQQTTRDPISDEMGQTLLAVFKSRSFAQKVIERYNLLKNPEFIDATKVHSMDEAIGALIGMSNVSIRHGTRFIDVAIQCGNPGLAKQLADAFADTFIQQLVDQRANTSKLAIDYLLEEAAKTKDKLQHSETALQDYVEKHNSISLQENQDTVVAGLKNLSTQLGVARAARTRLETDDEAIKKHLNDPNALLAIPSVADHPTIVASKQQIGELESKIVTLKLRYTDEHPKMIQAKAQLAEAKQALMENVLKIPPLIDASYEQAVATEDKFSKALADQEKVAMALNKESIGYNVLSRDVETDRALYEAVLTRLKEAKIATGVELTNVHIFERALWPSAPMQARKSRVLGISMVGGLLLGIGLSLGLNALDSSVKSVDQAEQIYELTVLAAVPRESHGTSKYPVLSIVMAPSSVIAEAFRSLRTALYLAGRNKGRKIVLFTSALAGEGKTFCSLNYAAALAQQGLKTLLIDADLRAPMVGTILMPGVESTGLAELLEDKSAEIHATDIENLMVLPAGKPVPNPAEVLAGPGFGRVISELDGKFDRIVIDTAPVTAVSDTLLLVEHAQAVCLVTRAGRTPRKWTLRAIRLLTDAGAKPTGLILNQVPMHMSHAYSYYPGSYGDPGVYGSNVPGRSGGKKEGTSAVEITPRT